MPFNVTHRLMYQDQLVGYRGTLLDDTPFDLSLTTKDLLTQDFNLTLNPAFLVKPLDLVARKDLLVPIDGSKASELTYGVFTTLLGKPELASTDEGLKTLYNRFNQQYFDSQLPFLVAVEWSNNLHRSAGYCKIVTRGGLNSFTIKLGVWYHRQRPSEIAATLVHEMIHVLHPFDKHGHYFQSTMHRLNSQFGLDINVHCDEVETRYLYVCLRCGQHFHRSRSLDVTRNTCGVKRGRAFCGGALELVRHLDSSPATI